MAKAKKKTKVAKSVAMPETPMKSDREHKSVTVRKIDNGFLAEHSHDTGGEYKTKTVYHPKKPNITLDAAPSKPLTKGKMKKLEKQSI